jgi:hypothetical protein
MRSLAVALLAGVLTVVFASSALAATCTDEFIAPSGEQWDVNAHWSTGKKPGPSDVACWPAGVTVLMTEPPDSGGGEVGAMQGGSLKIAKRNGVFLFGPSESTLSGSLTLEEQSDMKAFNGTLGFHVDGDIVDSPGKLEGEVGDGVRLTQGPGASFTFGGASQVEVHAGSSVATESPITIENPETNVAGPITTTSTITFAPGLSIDHGGGDFATFTAAGIEPNAGPAYGFGGDKLDLTGGTTTVAAGTKLESGPLTLEGGALQDEGTVAGTFDESRQQSKVTVTGGRFGGTGKVEGELILKGGTVAPGPHGTLSVAGNYLQEGGALAFGIGGTTPGSGFDRLLFTEDDSATFAGTLEAIDEGGFVPAAGDTFKVIGAAEETLGTFASLGGPSGSIYTPEYETDGLTLKATHVPPPVETPVTTTTGTSGTTTSASGASTTTGTPGVASTAAAVSELLHGCSASPLVLNDAYIHGGRVLLRGSAAASLVGKTVRILFNEKRTVAHAKVAAGGSFTTTAPLPPAKIRTALSTRYSAAFGKLRSLHLKLTRRLQLEPPSASGDTVTLSGHIELPLTKPATPVIVEQELECGKTTIVKSFTPPPSGRFEVKLAVPAGARAGVYTLKTKVAANVHDTARGFTTYSLPLPVSLG